MLRSIGFISCGFEEVVALFVLEEIADLADSLPELVIGSCSGFPDHCLEFGECHLDGVKVGGVWLAGTGTMLRCFSGLRRPWGCGGWRGCPE